MSSSLLELLEPSVKTHIGSRYKKIVPAAIRRADYFKDAIEIRKKIVARIGHFFDVGFGDPEYMGISDAEHVIWEWRLPKHSLRLRVTIYSRYFVRYSIYLVNAPEDFDVIRIDWVNDLDDNDLQCILRRWNMLKLRGEC